MSLLSEIVDAIFGPQRISSVDVEAVLTEKAKGRDLDWRHSIVDLLKLLELPSHINARKTLAHELGYTGKLGRPEMNIWLHKKVMTKLAENGGKVPNDLL